MISISGTCRHSSARCTPDTTHTAREPVEFRAEGKKKKAAEYLLGRRKLLLLVGDLRGDLARDPLAHLALDVGDVLPPGGRRGLLLAGGGRTQDRGCERDGQEQGRGAPRHLLRCFSHSFGPGTPGSSLGAGGGGGGLALDALRMWRVSSAPPVCTRGEIGGLGTWSGGYGPMGGDQVGRVTWLAADLRFDLCARAFGRRWSRRTARWTGTSGTWSPTLHVPRGERGGHRAWVTGPWPEPR
jgi:hypothetical protein